jgi:hypothetical protein
MSCDNRRCAKRRGTIGQNGRPAFPFHLSPAERRRAGAGPALPPAAPARAAAAVEDEYDGLELFRAAAGLRPMPVTNGPAPPAAPASDWVARLLATETFAQQRQAASRRAPATSRSRRCSASWTAAAAR